MWFLLLDGTALRNLPTPGDYQLKNVASGVTGGGDCIGNHNRLVIAGIPTVFFDFCRTRLPSVWQLRPPFTVG
jgi:hypothetical protein